MRRFSIRTLMAVILVSAIGLAALKNANDLWAGMMMLFALAAVAIAVMGAVILRGEERYWWAGFAFFCGGYLAISVGPWLSPWFRTQLGTTHLLDILYKQMFASGVSALNDTEMEPLLLEQAQIEIRLAHMKRAVRNFNDNPAVMMLVKRLEAPPGETDCEQEFRATPGAIPGCWPCPLRPPRWPGGRNGRRVVLREAEAGRG